MISCALGMCCESVNELMVGTMMCLPERRARRAEGMVPDSRLFVQRIRRNGSVEEASADSVLREGDVLAVAGARDVLVNTLGAEAQEVNDHELPAVQCGRAHSVERADDPHAQVVREPVRLGAIAGAVHHERRRVVGARRVAGARHAVAEPLEARRR